MGTVTTAPGVLRDSSLEYSPQAPFTVARTRYLYCVPSLTVVSVQLADVTLAHTDAQSLQLPPVYSQRYTRYFVAPVTAVQLRLTFPSAALPVSVGTVTAAPGVLRDSSLEYSPQAPPTMARTRYLYCVPSLTVVSFQLTAVTPAQTALQPLQLPPVYSQRYTRYFVAPVTLFQLRLTFPSAALPVSVGTRTGCGIATVTALE